MNQFNVLALFEDKIALTIAIKVSNSANPQKKTKEAPLSSTDRTPLFHKGDGRNVHVQTKGCMFVM